MVKESPSPIVKPAGARGAPVQQPQGGRINNRVRNDPAAFHQAGSNPGGAQSHQLSRQAQEAAKFGKNFNNFQAKQQLQQKGRGGRDLIDLTEDDDRDQQVQDVMDLPDDILKARAEKEASKLSVSELLDQIKAKQTKQPVQE